MRKAFLFVLYFLLACVAAQECAFPLTASGECSGTFSALNFEVADEDILVEVTVTEHSGEGVKFNYALGDLRLDGSAEGSFVISSPVVSEFAGESPASTRHFILSVLLCIMFLALREKRGALVLVIVLCAVAAPSVFAKETIKIVVSVPAGSDLPFNFFPGENFILTISAESKGKYALVPCSLIDNGCYRLSRSLTCVPGTYVDRTGTFAVCTGCTPVANSASPLLVECTTATNSRVKACAPGYFLNKAGAADVCTVCLNGGATYACSAGSYKTGTACTGTGNADTQTCTTCTAACPAGSFTQTACSASADRVCGVCTSVADCADAAVSCTTPDNSQCTTCKPGYWRDVVSGAATKCKPCMNGAAAFTCPAGSWKVATCTGTTTSDVQVCSPCRAACGAGSRQTAACTASADRQCTDCSLNCKTCTPGPDCAECDAEFYFDAPSKTCKRCTTCASNQFQSAACVSTATGAANRACVNCPVNCATCTSATACTSCKAGFAGVTCTDVCAVALIPNCAAVTCNTPEVGVHRCTGGCNVGFLLIPGNPTTTDSCTTACMANCLRCSTAGSCDLCAAGFFYSTTGTGAGVCNACTLGGATPTCPMNNYLAKSCSHGSDNLCLACTACPAGSYASSPCSGTTNTVCTLCTTCPGGFFQTSDCQAGGDNTKNRVCTPCKLASTCGPNEYATGCQATSDLTCTPCKTCTTSVQYESAGCKAGGDPTKDRVCTPCSVGCGSGFYQTASCSATTDRVCSPCATCSLPTMDSNTDGQYETTACQAGGVVTQNRVCTACTTCTSGAAYRTTQCQGVAGATPTQDRVCAGCTPCTSTQYQTADCGTTTDRTCASCASASCTWTDANPGNYQTQACTATQGQLCTACRTCVWDDKLSNPVDAPNGYFYETTKCRGTDLGDAGAPADPLYDITKNRVCTPCQSDAKNGPCGDGKYRQQCQLGGTAGNERVDALCQNCAVAFCKDCTTGAATDCTKCISGHRLVAGPPLACNPCSTSTVLACASTSYYDFSTCNGITDASCKPCNAPCATCSGAGTSACLSCNAGFYLTGTTCTACATCTAPQFETVACTTSSNRMCGSCTVANCAICSSTTTCGTCATGYRRVDATTCTLCTVCTDMEYKTGGTCDPIGTGDITCAACSTTVCTAAANPGGQYFSKLCRQDGVITQQNECLPCTACVAGANYESTPCQGVAGAVRTQNRVCTVCSACGSNQYQSSPCTLAANTGCTDCMPASCAFGQYEATPCGPSLSTNRVCATCIANIVSGTELPVASRTCSSCPSNQCNQCITGYYLLNSNNCKPCTVCGPEQYQLPNTGTGPGGTYGCESGVYDNTQLSGLFYTTGTYTGKSQFDRICVACTACGTNKYELTPCTPIADRTCGTCTLTNCDACNSVGTCTTCAAGFFYVADNTVTPVQYRCQACIATCPSGSVQTTACTHDTNRVCTACTQNCVSCIGPGAACTTCAAAYYLNTDSTCTACPVGCASCIPPIGTAAPLCGSCKAGFALASGICSALR